MSIRNIPFSPPDIEENEINEVIDTLKSGWITTGPKTKLLEEKLSKFIGTNRTVCLNSATACMEMTLRVLGIGEGDEVITTAYTYTASAAVIHHVGAKIVLVDTQLGSFEMDYEQLESKITNKTKAIIPVDIAGKMIDYKRLFEIVNRNNDMFESNNKLQSIFNRIIIVSDAAHSFGAKLNEKISGTLADFTCFSFHAVKNLTTAEGGAVTWKEVDNLDDDELYKEYMLYSLHGQSKDALSKSKAGSWEYDILYTGYKCNMTDIMASIGLRQLERYKELLERRREIINYYDAHLDREKLTVLEHYTDNSQSSGHLYLVRVNGIDERMRNQFIERLSQRGISSNVHYKPLPMHSAYKSLGFNISDFPNAYKQFENQITLPLHTKLSNEDIVYVVNNFNEILKESFND